MKRLKLLTSAFFVGLTLIIFSGKVQATEGTAEVTGSTNARCFSSSVMMQNFQFKIIVSCQNLIYPAAPDKFTYSMWAIPTTGSGTQKLGNLGVGKAEFSSQQPFSELFVTSERDDNARSPSTDIIMRGRVQPIQLLTTGVEQSSTLEPTKSEPAEDFGEIIQQPSPLPIIQTSPVQDVIGFLRRGGVIFAIAVFVILLILAALTRAKG